jgi:hypothetical protein
LTIGGVIGGMYYVRQSTLQVYGSGAAQQEWDEWREAVSERTTGSDPTKQRKTKTSVEPPALRLMRDHFAVCLALAVLLSSVLFVTLMFFARGVLQGRGGFVDRSNEIRQQRE